MNAPVRILRLLVICVLMTRLSPQLQAIYPEPPNVFFGRIRGPGGAPLEVSAFPVRLQAFVPPNPLVGRLTSRMVAEAIIVTNQALPELPDFKMFLRLDGGGIQLYHPMAVVEGERLELVAVYGGVTNAVVGVVPAIGSRGAWKELDLSIPCPDTDSDGLCDDCELEYFFSKNHPTRGQDDYDLDGFTNALECDSGTDPTDPSSVPGPPPWPPIRPVPGRPDWIGFHPDWDPQGLEWAEAITGPYSRIPSDKIDAATRSVKMDAANRFFRKVRMP